MNSENVTKNRISSKVDPMQIYKVIITARNNAAEARNGESEMMSGIIEYYRICIVVHTCAQYYSHFLAFISMIIFFVSHT